MSKKNAIRMLSFALAAVLALGIYSYVNARSLHRSRDAVLHSSQLAFEETVRAVHSMSTQLEKCPYVTDSAMRNRLCARISAEAMAAEAALSTLPFTTHELERISAYINQMGDYAFTLCSGSEEGFSEKQREEVRRLSALASDLTEDLEELRLSVHEGSILIDGADAGLANIGGSQSGYISEEFFRVENEFPQYDQPDYDGKYGNEPEEPDARKRSDAEMLAMAAGAVGASPAEMRVRYEYEDADGRKCYSHGETLVCVGPQGLESMSQSRLVSEETLDMDKAQEKAESYLEGLGYEDMALDEKRSGGGLASFRFISVKDDVSYPHNSIDVSVALDDGSIYYFSALDYSSRLPKLDWTISADEAAGALPQGVERGEVRKMALESLSGESIACYAFDCVDQQGRELIIYVSALSGKQQEIVIL